MVTLGRAKTQAGTGRLIPLNQPAFEALAKWAGRLAGCGKIVLSQQFLGGFELCESFRASEA
jgi:hypothetical protein